MGGGQASGQQSGPGGGLGPPIDAPDPLQKYRSWIIGGFVIALAEEPYHVTTYARKLHSPRQARKAKPKEEPVRRAYPHDPGPAPTATGGKPQRVPTQLRRQRSPLPPSMLLEALKEELFQLEVEHKQGKITQQEYEKAKAALDGHWKEPSSASPERLSF